jgi:hypothetical protein
MTSESKSDIRGYLLVGIPIVGGLLAALMAWVRSSEGSWITTIAVITSTAILVGVDAKARGMRSRDENGKRQNGPIQFAVGTLLLWIVAYPWYMVKRRQLTALGIVAAAIFVLAPLVVAIAYPNGRPPSASELATRVTTLIREDFMNDPKRNTLRVDKVTLVHDHGNTYEGVIRFEKPDTGESMTVPLSVIYDGVTIRWQINTD